MGTAYSFGPGHRPTKAVSNGHRYEECVGEERSHAENRRRSSERLDLVGENPALLHTLGLLLARTQRIDEAVSSLGRAAALAEDNTRYRHVYGVPLNGAGQADEALRVLIEAIDDFPNDPEIVWALATMHRDAGNSELARQYAMRLLEISPGNTGALQLLQQI